MLKNRGYRIVMLAPVIMLAKAIIILLLCYALTKEVQINRETISWWFTVVDNQLLVSEDGISWIEKTILGDGND